MNEIIVAGIGPGHPDYMLPAAARAIREAQVLVGGRRALSQFARKGQRTRVVTGDIAAVMQFIREALATSSVVVMVSGTRATTRCSTPCAAIFLPHASA